MRAFTVAFSNILSSKISFYSLQSVSSNFKYVDVVTNEYPKLVYDNQMQKFLYILNCSCPLQWKKKKECLIYNYIKQFKIQTNIIYFDLDVYMTPKTNILFENVFQTYTFDVSYIHRGFQSNWGIINTGIVLFTNTRQTQMWLYEMYNSIMRLNKDPQIIIDELLNASARKTFRFQHTAHLETHLHSFSQTNKKNSEFSESFFTLLRRIVQVKL